ncbi:MAG: hypothetical protein IJM30_09635 [Thermoguttaceae bacterium]|nr:hypothetical protein [Thermoguttaceae bacterium]
MPQRSIARKTRSRGPMTERKALALGVALFGAAVLASAPTLARTIINDSTASSNRFAGFSSGTVEKVAFLDRTESGEDAFARAERVSLSLAAPKGETAEIDGLTKRVPFVFPQGSDSGSASSVELLCSEDQGKTWFVYDSVRSNENRGAFQFNPPESGEYWLALKTTYFSGKVAYSAPRAYRFVGEASNDFSLGADDSNFDLLPPDEEAPPALPLGNEPTDDSLYVGETAAQGESDETESAEPKGAETIDPNMPRPGKLKTVSFGKEEDTDRLMVFVRWFRPEEIDEEFRGRPATLKIERGPTAKGPWESVGEDLSLEENGFGWVATKLDMSPFYVRLTVTDDQGQAFEEISSNSVDVNDPIVKKALGTVKTPIPFKETEVKEKKSSKSAKSSKKGLKKKSDDSDEISLIKTTSSESDEGAESSATKSDEEADEIDRAREETKDPESDSKRTVRAQQRKERPIVPAPTDPNRFQINPLFTRGPGVLYRSAQTRYEPDDPSIGKRSIFTPPSQAARAAAVPPARRKLSAERIAATNAKRARERYEREAKTAKEREMETFEQKPELMEGRVFYMDSDGNMTTTPPQEFLQAQNSWQLTNVGAPTQGDATPIQGGIQGGLPGEPVPATTDDYDARVNSGAATKPSGQFMGTESSSSSPLNNRYDSAPSPAPNGVGVQPVPQTSYSGALPYGSGAYAPQGSLPSQFLPPRPMVTR